MTDLTEMIAAPEGKALEFKRDLSSLRPILKTLVAFANTSGGALVIGRDDGGDLRGVPDAAAEEERLASAIADGIAPALLPDIEVRRHRGRDLLVVHVARWPGPFHLKAEGPERGVYVRLGSTNRKADGETLERLRREARDRAFDALPCIGADADDLDMDAIRRAFAAVGREIDAAKLESLGVLIRYGKERVPSNGGVLLFGRDEVRRRHFPDAVFRCARFVGAAGAQFLDQADFEGPVLAGIDEAIKFVRRNTRLAARIEGLRRRDIPEYPPGALREALVNAVAHTDYSLSGMNLRVAVYDDRLEVENPGALPFGLTVADLKAGVSRIRNPVIARVLRELELMEKWGSGYKRMRDECAPNGYPLPEWIELSAVVRCVFKPHPDATEAVAGLGPGQGTKSGPSRDQVRLLVMAREPRSITDLMASVGWKNRTKFRDKLLRPLLDSGLVAMTEPGKPTSSRQRYVTTEKGLVETAEGIRREETLETTRVEAVRAHVVTSLVGFGGQPGFSGSGTLVSIANDVVIATAGHVASAIHDYLRRGEPIVMFVSDEPAQAGVTRFDEIQSFAAEIRWKTKPDVGLIKLTQQVGDGLRRRAISLDQIARRPALDSLLQEHQEIAGFPISFKKLPRFNVNTAALSLVTAILDPCPHRHDGSTSDGIAVTRGYHVDWSPPDDAPKKLLGLWDPHGMSGGPVWTVKHSVDGELWSPPRKASLIGILFYWDKPSCLRAEPIEDWLRLALEVGDNSWKTAVKPNG